jgi:RNA polymerase sigma-70 factor (ECF subfamily)
MAGRIASRSPSRKGSDKPDGGRSEGPSLSDTELLSEIRRGNPAVADAFCRRVLPTVDKTVRRLLGGDDGESEDLAQVAITELVRTIGSFRGESSLDTWVSAVTAHVVYRFIRRRSINRYVPIESVQPDALHSPDPAGEDSVAQRETLARVVGHLDEMGEKMAWTFVLHDVLGYRLRDVARIMGGSEAAAQSRLVRGRKRLHELIADDPILIELRRATPAPSDDSDAGD